MSQKQKIIISVQEIGLNSFTWSSIYFLYTFICSYIKSCLNFTTPLILCFKIMYRWIKLCIGKWLMCFQLETAGFRVCPSEVESRALSYLVWLLQWLLGRQPEWLLDLCPGSSSEQHLCIQQHRKHQSASHGPTIVSFLWTRQHEIQKRTASLCHQLQWWSTAEEFRSPLPNEPHYAYAHHPYLPQSPPEAQAFLITHHPQTLSWTRFCMPPIWVKILGSQSPQGLPVCNLKLSPVPRQHVCVCVCVCAKLIQSCLIVCDPMDYSPPGSSVEGILQAIILEWIAVPSSRGSY